jgi:hypothetical protein
MKIVNAKTWTIVRFIVIISLGGNRVSLDGRFRSW